MPSIFLFACAWVLGSCALPFLRSKPPVVPPPCLTVGFDSVSAAADLAWDASPQQGFLQYSIQRSRAGRKFRTIAAVAGRLDTTYLDSGLLANTTYRYRVVAERIGKPGDDGKPPSVASELAAGGIHRVVNSWSLPGDFLPTRIAFDQRGILNVVGAGAGWVERFDRGGHSLGRWQFADLPNACLETGTLDGPAIALDTDGNLFVAFNTLPPVGAPLPAWAKFDRIGKLLWTRPLEGVFARHIFVDEGRVFIESISRLHQFATDGTRVLEYRVPALLVSSLRFWRGWFAALVEPLDVVETGWRAPRLVLYRSAEREEIDLVLGRDPLSDEDRGAGLLSRPSDFAFDERENRVFVVNAGYGRIEVFRDGEYLTRWASSGEDGEAFRFDGTARVVDDLDIGSTSERQVLAGGIALDSEGYIYVADTFNNRIQKFHP